MSLVSKVRAGIYASGERIEQAQKQIWWLTALPGVFVIGGLTFLYVWNGLRDLGLPNDAFATISRAAGFPDHFEWVSGTYPLGYPLLLRLTDQIVGDYRLAHHMLNAVSASITLVGLYNIARLFNLKRPTACLLVLMLGIAPTFVGQSTGMVTDIPHLMFLTLALWVLLGGESRRRLFWGGFLIGLAYLMRYTALYFMAATLIWIFLAKTWRSSFWLLAGWLLSSAPQWIPSLMITGNPIYVSGGDLIAIALFIREKSETSYWVGVADAPRHINMTSLILQRPTEIAGYVAENLRFVLFDLAKWTAPYLFLLVLPAIAWGFLRSLQEVKLRLPTLWWLANAAALATPIIILPRYLLPSLLITYLFVVLMIDHWNVSRKLALGFLVLMMALEMRWFITTGLKIPEQRAPEVYVMASQILNQLGAFEPTVHATVLDPGCGGGLFYNLQDPLKTPLNVTIVYPQERNNPTAFRSSMLRAGNRFVIVEDCDFGSGLDWLKRDLPEGLQWVAVQNTFSILQIDKD